MCKPQNEQIHDEECCQEDENNVNEGNHQIVVLNGNFVNAIGVDCCVHVIGPHF